MAQPSTQPRATIYLSHHDPGQLATLRDLLQSLEQVVSFTTDSGRQLIDRVAAQAPDLIVTSPRLADMDGVEALLEIGERKAIPSILTAATSDQDMVERAMKDHVMVYLVEPISIDDLRPALYLAFARFEMLDSLQRQVSDLEQRLEERKLVERAKGILMNQRKITEADAHQLLQRTARNRRVKLAEIAQTIVSANDLLDGR